MHLRFRVLPITHPCCSNWARPLITISPSSKYEWFGFIFSSLHGAFDVGVDLLLGHDTARSTTWGSARFSGASNVIILRMQLIHPLFAGV